MSEKIVAPKYKRLHGSIGFTDEINILIKVFQVWLCRTGSKRVYKRIVLKPFSKLFNIKDVDIGLIVSRSFLRFRDELC